MNRGLSAGFIVSVLLHLAILVFLLFVLPSWTPKEAEAPPETAVAMVFQSGATASIRAPTSVDGSASAQRSTPLAEPLPKPQPVEPPPPPPPPAHVELPTPIPPAPMPPPPTPPPESKTEVASVTPPRPAPPPAAPPKESSPLPVPPLLPAPVSSSVVPPPSVSKNTAPSSSSVNSTLDKLRQQLAQMQASKTRTTSQTGGQPNSGGNPVGSDSPTLSAAERGAIGDHVRECWTKDAGALDIDRQRVLLTVTTDASGMARKAEVAGDDKGRMGDPRFRAFAERAVRAIMDARCANLPLPANALGKVNTLTFRFSP